MKQSKRPILRTLYLSNIENLSEFQNIERKDLTLVKCSCETCGKEIDYRLNYLFKRTPKRLECCPCNTKRNKEVQKLERIRNLDNYLKEGVLKGHVIVRNLEDCKNLKNCNLGLNHIFYICRVCGNEVRTAFNYIQKDFTCSHCRKRPNQKQTSEKPIQVNSKEDLEKLKETFNSRTRITYLCNRCGDFNTRSLGSFKNFTCPKCKKANTWKSCQYFYDNQTFDSSWELAFYIWLKEECKSLDFSFHPYPINYWDPFKKVQRKYFPDFEFEDHYLEIKGPQLLDKDGKLRDKGKQIVLEELGVVLLGQDEIKPYLKYVSDKFGKNYLRSFRKERSSGKR